MGKAAKAVRHQRLVMAQIANERMLLGELKLFLGGRAAQEVFNFVQVPAAVSQRQFAGRFDIDRRVFGGQLQKALQHTNALRPAIFHHRLSPSAGMFSDESRSI